MNLRAFALLLLVLALQGQTLPAAPPLTVLSKDGRRPLAVSLVGGQDFVALDDLATLFQLAVHEETFGAITVSYKGKTIVLTTDQPLASIAGRLVSLPAAPVRSGRRALVPVEFISRALAGVYDARLDLRKSSRLLVVGDVRVPRITLRYEPLTAAARVTIDATPRTASTVSQENDKLLIKFDADAIDAALPPIPAQGLIQTVRVADAVSLAIDLGPRFAAFRAASAPLDGASRLTIDLIATQTESPAPASPGPPPAASPPAPLPDLTSAMQAGSAVRTIVIDPGHGGDDNGVVGPGGTKEKDLTLALARRLKAAIEGRIGIRVLLTRDDDRAVPLENRSAAANNNKADLFMSLHASASLRKGTTGASVFFAAFDQAAADQARASLGTERLPTFTGGWRDLELLPWDVAQIRHVERSEQLAHLLEQQFHDRVPLAPHPVERAPLPVLESANMPAVIVEVGYLTSPDQEKQLVATGFQTAFAQAALDAIVKFRDTLDAERGPR